MNGANQRYEAFFATKKADEPRTNDPRDPRVHLAPPPHRCLLMPEVLDLGCILNRYDFAWATPSHAAPLALIFDDEGVNKTVATSPLESLTNSAATIVTSVLIAPR